MAEYMIVKDKIIMGIFCGKAEEGSITLPDNHEVRVGEPLTFYNKDFTRKSEVQLIKEKLIELPKGYIVENDILREMTYDEKVISGAEPFPEYAKILDGKVVPMTEDEKLNKMTTEEKASYHRQKRDTLLNSELWKLQRHEQEKALGIKTTLSEEEYVNILKYIQALRDLPQQAGFPDNVIYPEYR